MKGDEALRLGGYLTVGDLWGCTETYRRFSDAIDPLPREPETVQAFRALMEKVVDQIIAHFGRERFGPTYGFCSGDLRRHLKKSNPETGRPYGQERRTRSVALSLDLSKIQARCPKTRGSPPSRPAERHDGDSGAQLPMKQGFAPLT